MKMISGPSPFPPSSLPTMQAYRWGPGEAGVRGERRGWAGTPRTRAVSISECAAPISFNRQRTLCTYTEVQWNVTSSAS